MVTKIIVIGFGGVSSDDDQSSSLMKLTQTAVSDATCQNDWNVDGNYHVCAVTDPGQFSLPVLLSKIDLSC